MVTGGDNLRFVKGRKKVTEIRKEGNLGNTDTIFAYTGTLVKLKREIFQH
jgi:hypothetical protein